MKYPRPLSLSAPRQMLPLLAAAGLLSLAGCGDDGPATMVADKVDASAASPKACSDFAAAAAGVTTRTIMVDGVQRGYELSIPSDYDPTTPARLVFGWHGLGGKGALLMSYTSVEGASKTTPGNAASIFAYPDGLVYSDFGATAWSITDAPLFDAIVAELDAELCIDSSRIFSYGHSFGGYFSNLLGCVRGNALRAIGPVAGGLLQGSTNCQSAMPAWLAHATNDTVVPVAQGEAARDKWLAENQCALTTQAVAPSPCVAYDGCQSGTQVVWCQSATGGHAWPAYANEGIWQFFASFDSQAL